MLEIPMAYLVTAVAIMTGDSKVRLKGEERRPRSEKP